METSCNSNDKNIEPELNVLKMKSSSNSVSSSRYQINVVDLMSAVAFLGSEVTSSFSSTQSPAIVLPYYSQGRFSIIEKLYSQLKLKSLISSSKKKLLNVQVTRCKFSSPFKFKYAFRSYYSSFKKLHRTSKGKPQIMSNVFKYVFRNKFSACKKIRSRIIKFRKSETSSKIKPQIKSKSCMCNFSKLPRIKSKVSSRKKFSQSEILKIHKAKLQAGAKTRLSFSKYEPPRLSIGHFHTFKKSLKASNKSFKKHQTHAWKNILQNKFSGKTNITKCNLFIDPKILIISENMTSKFVKCQKENSFDILKFKECINEKNDKNHLIPSKLVAKDPQSSRISFPYPTENIEPSISMGKKVTYINSKLYTGIKTGFKFNILDDHKTAAKTLLNTKSKSIHRKIIYDEKKEEERRKIIKIIEKKKQLIKYSMTKGKYSQNKKRFIIYVNIVQAEIDSLYLKLERLGKMPNCSDKEQPTKPKVKKTKSVKNFNILMRHLMTNVKTDVNIENMHEYINYETFKSTYDKMKKVKGGLFSKIESLKHEMEGELNSFNTYLKSNYENIFSGATTSINSADSADNIFDLCHELKKAADSNSKHLLNLKDISYDVFKSVRSYINLERRIYNNFKNFIMKDEECYYLKEES